MNAPRTLAEIATPALVVDVAAMERNIALMARYFADRRCKLRPHFKAHKCTEVARRQLAAGSCAGLTCATVSEAEVAGVVCDDILIANEIVDPEKCRRVAALARRVNVTVAVDSALGVDRIAAAAREAGATVGIVVDVNVGQNRCGVAPGGDAVALGMRVADPSLGGRGASAAVRLRGMMGYEGHAVGIHDRPTRETAVRQSMERLVETARMFRERGLSTEVVSSGGTGSYDISSQFDDVSEIQAGSYVLMDTDYAAEGLPFTQALAVLGTVVSRPVRERCVVDSGHKACSKDHGLPAVENIAGASVLALNDEHATISLPPDCRLGVGDRVKLLPSHIDPTINLHDVLYGLDGDVVVGVWPVDARGYLEHRRLATL
jgi:D-serine deaminase-like pyridoxal phosphate-dependent protein